MSNARNILLASLLLTLTTAGCLTQVETKGDDRPSVYELDGTYCNSDPLERTCLSVNADTTPNTYVWTQGIGPDTCIEYGQVDDWIIFTPDPASKLCLAPEYDLYSASANWTDTGIEINVDTATNEERSWGHTPEAHYRLTYIGSAKRRASRAKLLT